MPSASAVPAGGQSLFDFSTPMSMPMSIGSFGIPHTQSLSGPSLGASTPAVSLSMEAVGQMELTPETIRQRHDSGRRVSFGSVFPESSCGIYPGNTG